MEQSLSFENILLLFKETDRRFQETERLIKKNSIETERLIKESSLETDKRFQETERLIKENSLETERLIKESSLETERLIKESSLETDKKFRETDKKIKSLNNLFTGQWGKLMESLVEGDLVELLQARGISVNQTSQRIKKVYNNRDFEIDIQAKNGIEVVFVEVKTTLIPEHIEKFVKKLEMVKTVFPEYVNNKVYGAMAFLRSESDAHLRADRKGLFVIRATGKSASIINRNDFKPTAF
ncbi:MAG: hypothetical protein H7A23_02260 [Leptospiraceae bacterium]|nr:hypothetical protein [Leptospiraceae bacterium]